MRMITRRRWREKGKAVKTMSRKINRNKIDKID